MEEIFIPKSETIHTLFDGQVQYQIPSFQRPYSWETEHITDLWDDIFKAFEE